MYYNTYGSFHIWYRCNDIDLEFGGSAINDSRSSQLTAGYRFSVSVPPPPRGYCLWANNQIPSCLLCYINLAKPQLFLVDNHCLSWIVVEFQVYQSEEHITPPSISLGWKLPAPTSSSSSQLQLLKMLAEHCESLSSRSMNLTRQHQHHLGCLSSS